MATSYHVSRSIAAPVEAAWNLLTDASSYADWNPAVVSIEGLIVAGKAVRLVSIVNPKRTFKLKVVALEAPHRMVWASGMPLGLFTGERTYLLEPDGSGCRFSMTEEYSGPLAGLIPRSIPDMTDLFEAFADGLKEGAERAAG